MEFTNSQLSVINAKLPPKFKIEPSVSQSTRPIRPSSRRSQAEHLRSDLPAPTIPAKRPVRPKRQLQPQVQYAHKPKSEGFRRLMSIIESLKSNPKSEPFLFPVDPSAAPDYYDIIPNPMDLSTVQKKLRNHQYQTAYHFAMDVRCIWNNSFFYNDKNSQIFNYTVELSTQFERLMRGYQSIDLGGQKDMIQHLELKIEKLTQSFNSIQRQQKVGDLQRPMSQQDRKLLRENINKLSSKYLRGLFSIVKDYTKIYGEEVEIDIERLPPEVCKEADVYVKNCLSNRPQGGRSDDDLSSSSESESEDELPQNVPVFDKSRMVFGDAFDNSMF